ncbi:MAG TPA: hypothetical protein VIR01_10740 [Pyrinomonadaceae bacterium]
MKITDEVIDLSANLKKGIQIKVEKDGTAAVEVDKDIYVNNLPEGLDKDQISKAHQFNSSFYAAAAKAVGELSIDAMKKNANCKQIEVVIPLMGRDSYTAIVDREKSYPNPRDKEAPIKAFGVLNTQLDTVGSRSNRGVMKLIRAELSEQALKAFGS